MTAALGRALSRAGLTEAALRAWAGTHHLPAVALDARRLRDRPLVPAASALALFVAGTELPLAHASTLPVEELLAEGLVERTATTLHATVAILPLDRGLLVCDRADTSDSAERVCWPDDSSYHLARALAPGRRRRWLDLATGSAFAPLLRPELAHAITGVDLAPRAVRYAELGARLSRVTHFAVHAGDVAMGGHEPADLVTCNAPIAGDPALTMWRRTDAGFFARMFGAARAAVAPGGEIVIHCTLETVPDELPGEVAISVYTPPGERAFAITWWRPDAAPRRLVGSRALTAARPHVEPSDRPV